MNKKKPNLHSYLKFSNTSGESKENLNIIITHNKFSGNNSRNRSINISKLNQSNPNLSRNSPILPPFINLKLSGKRNSQNFKDFTGNSSFFKSRCITQLNTENNLTNISSVKKRSYSQTKQPNFSNSESFIEDHLKTVTEYELGVNQVGFKI